MSRPRGPLTGRKSSFADHPPIPSSTDPSINPDGPTGTGTTASTFDGADVQLTAGAVGIKSSRRQSARDQPLHRRLGELVGEDLSEVVLQMRYVVAHEIVERRGLVMRNWFRRKFVEIMSCPFAKTLVYRRDLHDARYVQVEIAPKVDEFFPRRFGIPLQRNPRVLLITIKDQIILQLCAHEPLMVVDFVESMVPDYLAGTPIARPR